MNQEGLGRGGGGRGINKIGEESKGKVIGGIMKWGMNQEGCC